MTSPLQRSIVPLLTGSTGSPKEVLAAAIMASPFLAALSSFFIPPSVSVFFLAFHPVPQLRLVPLAQTFDTTVTVPMQAVHEINGDAQAPHDLDDLRAEPSKSCWTYGRNKTSAMGAGQYFTSMRFGMWVMALRCWATAYSGLQEQPHQLLEWIVPVPFEMRLRTTNSPMFLSL
ncbi:unnamed protein product [Symbiodinium sp. CCMP2456]|nr:unnamed protein product [Symbiodinium sp. CCMP2456]